MFQYGDNVVLRAIINGRLWSMQSVIVVKDTAQETVVLLAPGAQCAYPSGYWRWKRGNTLEGTRWDDVKSMTWTLREFEWHTNRLLIHMVPERYYATYLIWDGASDRFKGYYINFQMPFQHNHIGFDTLDLELDIVIDPLFNWQYKDEDNYFLGLREGCVTQSQNTAVEDAKPDIYTMINGRHYPLDGSWVDWRPDPEWEPARLPKNYKE